MYLQGNFYRVVWTYYVVLTIFIGVHCTLYNDDIQLYACPKALDTQTLPIAATAVEAMQLDKVYMSMRLSSSLPSGVDANMCVCATLVKLLMNICVLVEVVFTAIVCSRLLKFAPFGLIYCAVWLLCAFYEMGFNFLF